MSVYKEFREFAIKGSVVDLALGVIIGGAFGGIITSLVNDVVMPPVGLLVGNVDFGNLFVVLKEGVKEHGPYASLAAAKTAGAVTLNLGVFLNTVINFFIVACAMFIVVKFINRLRRQRAAPPDLSPAPPRSEMLLEEIRDLLKKRS
jgi:large conductance mechanosensitive channel